MSVFHIKSKTVDPLKQLAEMCGVLVDEITLKIDSTGITARAMDPSRVAMIDLARPKEVFEEIVCTEPFKLCLNVQELLKILKRVGKDESVELSLDDKTGKLLITIVGKSTRKFTLSLLDPSEEEVPTPKITFNVKAKTVTAGLCQAIEDAQLVSDHVRLEAIPEKLTLGATGDLMGATITLQKGSDTLLDFDVKADSQATYILSYLSQIIKTAKSEVALIEFSTDMPIKIDFEQTLGNLTFFLAPRIETQ